MDLDACQIAADICKDALKIAFLLSAPLLLIGMIVGVLISIGQAATQIQEQTLTFVPKILAVLGILFLLAPWFIQVMVEYTADLYADMAWLFTDGGPGGIIKMR